MSGDICFMSFFYNRQERGLRRGENFWLRLTTAQCLRLSGRFFFIDLLR